MLADEQIEEEKVEIVSSKNYLFGKLKYLAALYMCWIFASLLILRSCSDAHFFFFADLPSFMMKVPPVIISFVYLALFIPAFFSVIIFALYLVISTLLSYKTKD